MEMVFPPGGDTAIRLKPSKESLDLPSAAVSSQRSPILSIGLPPINFMWSDHLDTHLSKLGVQRIAVISLVTDDSVRKLYHEASFQGFTNQFHFMRRSAVHVEGDRKTMAVRNCHDFRSFPPFRFPHARPPFFAGEKVPSIKASLRSRSPRSRRSSARARRMSSKSPSLVHLWNQRWQVDLGGYREGRSFHWAPVRRIQRMPLSNSRRMGAGSAHGDRSGLTESGALSRPIVRLLSPSTIYYAYFTKVQGENRQFSIYFGMGSSVMSHLICRIIKATILPHETLEWEVFADEEIQSDPYR